MDSTRCAHRFKNRGSIITNYNETKALSDSTSIRLGIINYLEDELLTLKVNLNKSFPQKAQNEDDNLQEIIQFVQVDSNKTKIISTMVGWGQGEEWNKTYSFFERGNGWTFQQMLKIFK